MGNTCRGRFQTCPYVYFGYCPYVCFGICPYPHIIICRLCLGQNYNTVHVIGHDYPNVYLNVWVMVW